MNADGMINHDPHARIREVWLKEKWYRWDLEYYANGIWERLVGSDFGNKLCTYRLTNTTTGETIVSPGIEMPVIEDMVNRPAHYASGEIECIDAMVAAFGEADVLKWAQLNAFKYLWRCEKKGGKQDIDKAIWYLRYSNGDDPRKDK